MEPVILVTGSEGNIGAYVVDALRARCPNARLIRTSRRATQGADDVVRGDLTDASFVKRLFEAAPITHVIHLAAQSYTQAGFKERAYDLLSNDTRALLNLLDASASVQKFVYLSSALVYERSDDVPFTEDQLARIPPPISAYGLAKWYGEQAVLQHATQYENRYTIWRPFNVVSPREPHDTLGRHVFVDFYRKLFVEHVEQLKVFGNGAQQRCFVWVEDVADAIALHLLDVRTDNAIFNIGSSSCATLTELAALFLSLGKEHSLLPAKYAPEIVSGETFYGVDTAQRIPSLEKIRAALGWTASTDFRTCFEKFILAKQS